MEGGAPGRTRTCDLWIRNPRLYPAELPGRGVPCTGSLTEAILPSANQLHHIEVVRHSQGVELQMSIPEPAAAALKDRGRSLIGRVGCGLCGVESIQEVMRECRPISDSRKISVAALWRAERELPTQQHWNRETGSLHAAAWASDAGGLEVVREDVGRHNALDKVFGALARAGKDPREGFIVITSRASYELVQKVAIMGGRLLAAVSRPTGLAIRLAEASGVTLVALLRGETANVYAHGERLE